MCEVGGCDRQAGYGEVGGQATACRAHKTDRHVPLRGSSSTTRASAMVLRSASAKPLLHTAKPPGGGEECSSCGHAPRPPPTESFYFCMNTPWWSPGGPAPGWYGGDGDAAQGAHVLVVGDVGGGMLGTRSGPADQAR